MLQRIKSALIIFSFFTILTGLGYPLLFTGTAQVLFPQQSNGSLLFTKNSLPIGSALIGQSFTGPKYFWGRPSATSGEPYNAGMSGGSNLSVLNDNLIGQVQSRLLNLEQNDSMNSIQVPVDLVTSSASGLDPHISPAAAYYQVPRIARERSITEEKLRSMVQQHIELPFLGIFGEPRVNILLLNLALNSLQLDQ